MDLLLICLLAIALFVAAALRRQGADLASMSVIDHVGAWLHEHDINREVRFVNYTGRPYAETDDATVVIGQGLDANGYSVGFCAEVHARDGLVAAILIDPASLVLSHRKAARHSRKTGLTLRTALAHSMLRQR